MTHHGFGPHDRQKDRLIQQYNARCLRGLLWVMGALAFLLTVMVGLAIYLR